MSEIMMAVEDDIAIAGGADHPVAIIGAVTGVIVSLAVVVAFILCVFRRRTKHQEDGLAIDTEDEHTYYNTRPGAATFDQVDENAYANVEELDTNNKDTHDHNGEKKNPPILEKRKSCTEKKKKKKPPVDKSKKPHVGEKQKPPVGEKQKPLVDESKKPPATTAKPSIVSQPVAEHVYENISDEETATVSRPVRVEEFAADVLHLRQGERFKDEFETIPNGRRGKCTSSNRKGIKDKLRFRNIFPYDHSRVVLSTIEGDPLSDYINANFVHGHKKVNYYIASQGPLNTTVEDFWRMIWEQKIQTLVMLTACVERETRKCYQYWPEDGSKQYGDITVRVKNKVMMANFTIQNLLLERMGQRRTATHFQYTTWPDKGVPDYASSLLNFRRRITAKEKPPVLVHCSAGVGRTGVYIAMDYLLEQAEAEGVVDVVGCVNLMRENRMEMVQTLGQYQFVYTTVLESLQVGNTSIPSEEFLDTYRSLKKIRTSTKKTALQEQFELLETMKPATYDFEESRTSMSKNRNQEVLAADQCRAFLRYRPGMKSTYINAVIVEDYRSTGEFIATQMPLADTRRDLWRLVEDFNVSTMVMLTVKTKDGNYFPDNDTPLEIEPFSIVVASSSELGHGIRKRDITLNKGKKLSKKVHHLEFSAWDDTTQTPVSLAAFVALFTEVQRLQQQRTGSRVVVQCLDGAQRCGLFCALYFMLEKMNAEHEVDVFNAVKRVRLSRPEFISNVEQYLFLHDAAQEYMAAFETYANFK